MKIKRKMKNLLGILTMDYKRKEEVVEMVSLTCTKCHKTYEAVNYNFKYCSSHCHLYFYIFKQKECWLWTGAKNTRGTGQIWVDGKQKKPNRLAYELFYNVDIVGKRLFPECLNRLCCNPKHMSLLEVSYKKQMIEDKILSMKEILEIEVFLIDSKITQTILGTIYGVKVNVIKRIKKTLIDEGRI